MFFLALPFLWMDAFMRTKTPFSLYVTALKPAGGDSDSQQC
jgi:hypothetical protein